VTTFAEPVFACDASYWQQTDKIDYLAAYEAGCVLAIIKRSQLKASTKGREHARLVDASPASRGDYHYADTKQRRHRLKPELQAETFCLEVGDLQPGDSIPWLDLEWHRFESREAREEYYRDFSRRDQTDWALAWLYYVEQRLGVRGGIYTLASFGRYRLDLDDEELTASPLWLANAGRESEPKLSVDVPTVEIIEAGWDPKDRPGWLSDWVLYQWWTGKGTPWYRGGEGRLDLDKPRHGMLTIGQLLLP
jgi:GH25 family lysozyme M1 (1,4-beta-N-acetylmuramidase)